MISEVKSSYDVMRHGALILIKSLILIDDLLKVIDKSLNCFTRIIALWIISESVLIHKVIILFSQFSICEFGRFPLFAHIFAVFVNVYLQHRNCKICEHGKLCWTVKSNVRSRNDQFIPIGFSQDLFQCFHIKR